MQNKNKSFRLIILLFLGFAALSSCKSTKFLGEGEYLHQKNQVELRGNVQKKDPRKLENGIEQFIQQTPNSKFLFFFKTKMWFYNLANAGKDNKFNNWIKEKLGEKPVIYDSSASAKSTQLMENYLQNKGYFFNEVTYEHKFKNNKAFVTYHVNPKTLYRIDSVIYPNDTGLVEKVVKSSKDQSLLQPGEPFDVDQLKAERDRIAGELRNKGFYYFNKEYIYYDLDSSGKDQKLDVYVRVKSPSDSSKHNTYTINNIYVYTDYSFNQKPDRNEQDTIPKDEYYFIAKRHKYKPQVLINSIFFSKSEEYKLEDNKRTINALADLNIFKFINVKFREVSSGKNSKLNVFIYLTPAKKQEMSVEVEVNNSTDYDLGSAATYNYKNKNIFKGGELFDLNLSGGIETQFDEDQSFINTLDFTSEVRLKFPQFLTPLNFASFGKRNRPKTIFSLQYNFQKRINFYSLYSTNFSFGYEWKETKRKRHFLHPIVINQVELIQREPAFNQILEESPVLKSSFTDQRILGSNYSFVFTNQLDKEKESFFFFQANADLAGNVLQGINWLASQFNDKESPYDILGRPYSQFFRTDLDYRYFFQLNSNSKIATRIAGGVGVSYGNSDVLPYVKRFFTGGSNNIRAWRVRTVGPGSFNIRESPVYDSDENSFIDQTGDMKLEANVEYRFDIFKMLKGALFVDAGNIWLLDRDSTRLGGKFEPDSFLEEVAIGTGAGLRLDFSFFVIRFDIGLKTYDPALNGDNRWVIKEVYDQEWQNDFEERFGDEYDFFNLNLSIGYPF